MRHFALALVAVVAVAVLSGCTNYYKITDPSTGKDYYATEYDQSSRGTQLTDSHTGARVTLQNVEIRTITREEFDTARAKPE